MFEIMTVLHILAAVFVVGPLVHAVTTAGRGLRRGDAAAVSTSARMTAVYAYASVLVVVFGFGLMSAKSPYTDKPVAAFGDTWIWLSALLWLVGAAVALVVTAPALRRAAANIGDSAVLSTSRRRAVASGMVVAVIFVVIVVLMVYQP